MTVRVATTRMDAYWESKAGSARGEWEDGVAYSPSSGVFAVADGASTGSKSREWAHTLVESFLRAPVLMHGDMPDVRARFLRWTSETRGGFDPESANFERANTPSWVQSQSRQDGAHATVLAGRVADGQLIAISYGDCCLFHVSETVTSFPAQSTDDFGFAPDLVSSLGNPHDPGFAKLRRYHAEFGPQDTLFVTSDAFGEWLIKSRREFEVWSMLKTIGAAGFAQLCNDLRDRRLMKNDDVTMLRVEGGSQ